MCILPYLLTHEILSACVKKAQQEQKKHLCKVEIYAYTRKTQMTWNGATNTQTVHKRKPNTGAVMINCYNIINYVCLFTEGRLLFQAHEIFLLHKSTVQTHVLKFWIVSVCSYNSLWWYTYESQIAWQTSEARTSPNMHTNNPHLYLNIYDFILSFHIQLRAVVLYTPHLKYYRI